MQGRLVVGWWSRGGGLAAKKPELMRLMVTKASNRAAVHGVRPPIPDTVDKEEVEKEISKGKEMKESKRKRVEETVDSQLKQLSHDILFPPPDDPKI
ncbi:hypothetical protein FNV43_RR08038 [Rhamnella rubrinervis]|uniref:Uncharacterized protein n=1 Tax=Rhamnella rubrinervis TaxID=2594499 RepID=A0A8K0MMW9_9ROSA|nr:hypothetical protein FNV43_RR08038 [Rhamnella rubrinervis]